jgi:hypothetical protein
VAELTRTERQIALTLAIRSPQRSNCHDGNAVRLAVDERDSLTNTQLGAHFLRQVKRDRQREQRAVLEAHISAHTLVVLLPHEAAQWREGTVQQELHVAQMPLVQPQRR